MTQKRTLAIRPDPGGVAPETAMIMAAGLGKRMRPLTATRPKPLVEVAGKPLIDHAFDRLRAAGVKRAVVNVHYLADALEAHLKNRVKGIDILVSDERGARRIGAEGKLDAHCSAPIQSAPRLAAGMLASTHALTGARAGWARSRSR